MNLGRLFLLFISLYLTFPFLVKGFILPLQLLTYGLGFTLVFYKFSVLKARAIAAYEIRMSQKFLLLFGFILLSAFLWPVLHYTNDFSFIITCINEFKVVIRMMTIYFLACFIYKRNISNEEYFDIFINVNCLYILSSCLFLFFPSLRHSWNSIIYIPSTQNMLIDDMLYNTRYGLQGFSGFLNTCYCMIALLFNLYLIERERLFRKTNIRRVIFCCILVVGTMFYGRIGLILSLTTCLSYIFYLVIIRGKIKVLLLSVTVLGILSFAIYYVVTNSWEAEIWFNWAYEPFVNYFSGNDFESASSNHLQEMWEIPSFETIIVGDGRYIDPILGSYYKATDVGYIRNILFGGIVPTLLIIYCFYCSVNGVQPRRLRNRTDTIFIYAIFITGLIIEAKGEFILFLAGILYPLFFTKKLDNSNYLTKYDV